MLILQFTIKIMWEEQLVDPPVDYIMWGGGVLLTLLVIASKTYSVLLGIFFYLINDSGIFTAFCLKPFVM